MLSFRGDFYCRLVPILQIVRKHSVSAHRLKRDRHAKKGFESSRDEPDRNQVSTISPVGKIDGFGSGGLKENT